MNRSYDVVVVGAGPNGLAAGIVAARCGLSTLILEAADLPGGGARSAELTLPGFVHDTCSSVHPMAVASPLLRRLPLAELGLRWVTPPAAAAHPLDSGDAGILSNNLEETARSLGADAAMYRRTTGVLTRHWPKLEWDLLGPIGIPQHPLTYMGFGVQALLPAVAYAKAVYSTEKARALFAGCAAHSIIPLSGLGSAAFGLILAAVAHVQGWPVPRGGSQALTDAMVNYYRSLGGELLTGHPIEHRQQLPEARAFLFDTAPKVMARILGAQLRGGFRRALERYRYGPGVFKIDWALREPIPWKAKSCQLASTVHVCGTLEEVAASEKAAWSTAPSDRPFVMVTQPSLFDATRAPLGRHTAWAYCHVPNGYTGDMSEAIEAQMERFAPGFRDVVLARAVRSPQTLESGNANLVGGDVGGGSNALLNLLFRPTIRTYSTPLPDVFLCSAATPPGAGVHGMSGYHAAVRAIGRRFGKTVLDRSGLAPHQLLATNEEVVEAVSTTEGGETT